MASKKLTYSILKQLLNNKDNLKLFLDICLSLFTNKITDFNWIIYNLKDSSKSKIIDNILHDNNITLDDNSKIVDITSIDNPNEKRIIFVFNNNNLSYLFGINKINNITEYSVYNFVNPDKILNIEYLGLKYSSRISYYFKDGFKYIISKTELKNNKLIDFVVYRRYKHTKTTIKHLIFNFKFIITSYENGQLVKKYYGVRFNNPDSTEILLKDNDTFTDENFINEHYDIDYIYIIKNELIKKFSFYESEINFRIIIRDKDTNPIILGNVFKFRTKCDRLLIDKTYKNGKLISENYTKRYLEYYNKLVEFSHCENKNYTEIIKVVIDKDEKEFERKYIKTNVIEKGIYKDHDKISELYFNNEFIMELDTNKHVCDFTNYFNKIHNKNINLKVTENIDVKCPEIYKFEFCNLDNNIWFIVSLYNFGKKSINSIKINSIEGYNQLEKSEYIEYINEIEHFLKC